MGWKPNFGDLKAYFSPIYSRTIVQDYLSQLTRQLDFEEKCYWETKLVVSADGRHYTFLVNRIF